MPTYRLPQRVGSIEPLDELGMAGPAAPHSAEQPVVAWIDDEQEDRILNVYLVADGCSKELSVEQLADDAARWDAASAGTFGR